MGHIYIITPYQQGGYQKERMQKEVEKYHELSSEHDITVDTQGFIAVMATWTRLIHDQANQNLDMDGKIHSRPHSLMRSY